MWSSVVHSTINNDVVPKSRSKHAVCLGVTFVDDQLQPNKPALFLLGGRMSNVALRDFWVMDMESGLWTLLSGNGKEKTNGKTPNVQEHTMVFWNNSLYVFGGTFTQNGECPLWIFEIRKNTWTQWQCPKGKDAPQCRKAHTAVLWKNNMLIYGGYQDFRGSLNELWLFSFDSNEWKLLSGNQPKRGEILPPSRHSHSAVIYENEMFIYGGMTDLISRSDFWKYDFIGKRWEQIKMTKNAKINPGTLHGHAAVIFKSNNYDAMLLIGGEKPDGSLSDQVWSYNLSSELWERMEFHQPRPSARTQLTALTLNTTFFTFKSDCKPSTAKRAQSSSVIANTDNEDSMMKKMSSFASTQGTLKTRSFVPTSFTLGRNPGYHLVSRNENVDLSPPASRLPKSRYSILSNASNDSLAFDEMNAEDNLPNMMRPEEKSFFHRSVVKFRSESVHDFVTRPATRCVVPRSQTTARFNPFDPTKVRRDETFDITTSDYASEMDESFASSFIGIPNPVYDDFVTSNIAGIIPCENRDEEHRNFALALNNSLETKKYRGERYVQLRKMLFSNEQTDFGEQLQVLGDPNVLNSIEDENNLSIPPQELCDSASLGKDWCILSIGGRESESKSNMFPSMPLSIWMLQIN